MTGYDEEMRRLLVGSVVVSLVVVIELDGSKKLEEQRQRHTAFCNNY